MRFCVGPGELNAVYELLGCGPDELDLSPEAAISVLKDWYAGNPIEPDSLQDDVFHGKVSSEELDLAGLSMDESFADETSSSC